MEEHGRRGQTQVRSPGNDPQQDIRRNGTKYINLFPTISKGAKFLLLKTSRSGQGQRLRPVRHQRRVRGEGARRPQEPDPGLQVPVSGDRAGAPGPGPGGPHRGRPGIHLPQGLRVQGHLRLLPQQAQGERIGRADSLRCTSCF